MAIILKAEDARRGEWYWDASNDCAVIARPDAQANWYWAADWDAPRTDDMKEIIPDDGSFGE